MFKKTDSEIKELFGEAQTRKDIANLLEIDEKSGKALSVSRVMIKE